VTSAIWSLTTTTLALPSPITGRDWIGQSLLFGHGPRAETKISAGPTVSVRTTKRVVEPVPKIESPPFGVS